jgi:hypothetical protein
MPGVRVELAIDDPAGCPVAELTEGQTGRARSVTWSDADGTVTEQFEYDGVPLGADGDDGARGDVDGDENSGGDVDRVFEYDDASVYEFEREDRECVCQTIAGFDCPLADVEAADGTLYVSIHLREAAELRDLLQRLREVYSDVRVRCLVGSGGEASGGDVVPVDRSRLTERQQEAVGMAHRMGYFDYPRQSNASEVADALGVAPSTFTEHLTAAQSKLLDAVLDTAPRPREESS